MCNNTETYRDRHCSSNYMVEIGPRGVGYHIYIYITVYKIYTYMCIIVYISIYI